MSLPPGTRLGHYEILTTLGAGGMGEVYRARDTKLHRDVAIKVLPDSFANDPDRLARFQREAQVLASLNHPNIAHIHGLEESGGVRALVMELVEGEDLAQRLTRGAIPIDEAVPIAKQIAEALEAAHEQGIIHRDLKPANIKVRADGTVKVLDFGLAKAMEPVGVALASVSRSPTITTPAMMTGAGTILGTAAYMSPEQAKGRPADKRSDIWAFGCVLYEMLAGKRAFEGEDVSDTLAAVLRDQPDWDALPATTPPLIRNLIARCLAKDSNRRVADISVPLFVLDESSAVSAPNSSVVRQSLWGPGLLVVCAIVVGVLAVVTAIGVTGGRLRSTTVPVVTRFPITLSEEQRSFGASTISLAVSPDGTLVAYGANRRGLYLRSMSNLETKAIPGIESVVYPVFSPDSRFIVFWSPRDAAIKRIPVSGGPATTLYTGRETLTGPMSWDKDGIVFGVAGQGIVRVSANGAELERLINARDGEITTGPTILPGGDAALFTVASGLSPDSLDRAHIVVQSLRTGERKTLIERGSDARYLKSGHLVYVASGTLFALPFDVRRLSATGQPVPVLEGVRRNDTGVAQFSVSDTGSLIYLPGPSSASSARSDIVIMDFNGSEKPLKLPPAPYEHPRVSPDGQQVAVDTDDGNEAIVWVYNLSGTTAMRRLTFGGRNRFPIWSADGKRITFQSNQDGDLGIFWQHADGNGAAERLTTSERGTAHVPDSWSANGNELLFEVTKGLSVSLWTLSPADKRVVPFGESESTGPFNGTFSPDGRWVAYSTTPGNRIVVQPFPQTGTKYEVSERGIYPLWAPDGKRLFYNLPGQLVAVTVSTQPIVAFGNPVALPRGTFLVQGPLVPRNHDITPDGKGIVGVITPVSGTSDQTQTGNPPLDQIQVVLNWSEELKAKVPTK
jgi:serine/threonine protein kinase/Tol biopolymer transport system component